MAIHLSLTQSLAIETKQFIQQAEQEQKLFTKYVVGRCFLLVTAIVGTIEIIARLVSFLLGQIGGILTFYQSESINLFLKEQVKSGFAATIITSASFFSLLSPSLFTSMQLPNEEQPNPRMEQQEILPIQRPLVPESQQPQERESVQQLQENNERELDAQMEQIIWDIVRAPFQLIAWTFQLPFYCIYLTFQAMLLPVRIALLPLQIACIPFQTMLSAPSVFPPQAPMRFLERDDL